MIVYTPTRLAALRMSRLSDNPFVAFDNLGGGAVLGGHGTLTDGARGNAVTGTTYDYWLPNTAPGTARLIFTFPAAATMSFAAVAGHNIGTLGGRASIQRSTDGGSTWSYVLSVEPETDDPISFRMDAAGNDAATWALYVTDLAANAPLYVAVVFLGNEVIFPRRFYSGFSPAIEPTEVQLQSNVSVGGNLLGNSVVSKGSTLSAPFQHLEPSFVRGPMRPFIPHFNAGRGFFFGWRPDSYRDDVHYCWRDGDVLRPTNDGGRNFMSVTLNMRAYNG